MKLSQTEYIEKVPRIFNIVDAKLVNFPLRGYFKLLKAQEPKTNDEKALMSKVPYVSAMGSLIYAMIYTRPKVAQTMEVVDT